MQRFALKILAVAGFACGLQMPGMAQQGQAGTPGGDQQEISVTAKKAGDQVVVDVSLYVAATQQQAWEVLTDYDHMPAFLPNLRMSKIISRSPTEMRVAQKGGVSHGPLSLTFDVVRDVQLKGHQEIISHVISGDLKKVDSTTRLSPEGEGTRIIFHSESIPNVWVPPGIGPTIVENETRDQFNDMRTEILRRKAGGK